MQPDPTSARPNRRTVVIIDDHRSFGEALGLAISLQEDLSCVGEAGTLAAGLDLLARFTPDVVVLDMHLPDGDGVEAIAAIKARRPETRVVMLTGHADITALSRAAAAGASSFLPKETSMQGILAAIRDPHHGRLLVQGDEVAAMVERSAGSGVTRPAVDPLDSGLTARELDVLRLLGRGYTTRAVAEELFISVNTARGYIKDLLPKLGAHSQLEAVTVGIRRGLIPSP